MRRSSSILAHRVYASRGGILNQTPASLQNLIASIQNLILPCISSLSSSPPPNRAFQTFSTCRALGVVGKLHNKAAITLPAGSGRRFFQTSSTYQALGVVEQLHDEVAIALPAGSSRRFWEVIEFRPDATALETWKTPEVLGLHPRDVHLFTSDTATTQRAMLAARSGVIMFRTEIAKAVIFADKAVLFPARRLQDTVKVAQAIKSALSQRSALPFELKVLESLLSETALAFDRRTKRLAMVAETIMDDINRNFHASAAELQRSLPVARKLTEVQHDVKETLDAIAEVADYDDQLQALCLTERAKALAAGSKGTAAAIKTERDEEHAEEKQYSTFSTATKRPKFKEPSSSSSSRRDMSTDSGYRDSHYNNHHQSPPKKDKDKHPLNNLPPLTSIAAPSMAPVAAALPSTRSTHMRMASRILEAYEYRMMGTHSALNEMLENMEQTRTVWHMQLDHERNRVLRVNLLISVFSLGGLLASLPAAYFGMNLDSGLEDLPGLFWPVVQSSALLGITSASLIYGYYKFGPKRRYAARLRDMRSLRDLLSYHIDDLDAIIDAVRATGSLTKNDFTRIVKGAIRGKPMSNEEIALLFRVFDANKDAVLELSELMRLEEMEEKLQQQDPYSHHVT